MPRPILGALQLEGEVFSLDIPSYRTRIPGRSRPRTITSQRTGQKRVDGAECRDQSSAHFSSREKYFLLTFPLIELSGGIKKSFGDPNNSAHWIVNSEGRCLRRRR